MGHRIPPLPWRRAVEASARHLSFTSAPVELDLTRAAVSKQVKLLEHYLREPMVERLPRSVTLTKAGAAYLPKVQDAFERLSAGTVEVFGGGAWASCRCGRRSALPSPGWPRACRASSRRIPRRRCASSPRGGAEDYDSETFDLDIRYGFGRWAGFDADRVTRERLLPVWLPEFAARMASPEDLAKERLLHVFGYQEGWAIWLAAAGTSHVDPGSGLWFDTTPLALEVAAQGGGVALGRSSMLERELASGRLVLPFDLDLPIEEGFFLVAPGNGPRNADAALFRDWLLAEAQAGRD